MRISIRGGFTLVELMVGLVVGLLVISGVVQAYAGAAASQRVQNILAESAERIRFAVGYVGHDLRMAGYKAAGPPVDYADGWLIVRYGDVVAAYSVSGGTLRYRRAEGGTVVYNNQPILDGFRSMDVWFGIGDPTDGGIRFLPAADADSAALDDVRGVRVAWTLEDARSSVQIVETTIALRNR